MNLVSGLTAVLQRVSPQFGVAPARGEDKASSSMRLCLLDSWGNDCDSQALEKHTLPVSVLPFVALDLCQGMRLSFPLLKMRSSCMLSLPPHLRIHSS